MPHLDYRHAAIYATALVATLMLAALLTPNAWWRRPNLRAACILALGTWGIGALLMTFVQTEAVARPMVHAQGARYRVADDLNLRTAKGTQAARLATVRAGSTVTATGARDGDWWQVRAEVDGRSVEGWSSSLWLRRLEE